MFEVLQIITNLAILAFVLSSMLAMGLSLTPSQILDSLRDMRLIALALLANFVLVPALAFILTRVIPLDPQSAIGLLLVGAAAGAPFLPRLAQLAKGPLAFAVSLMIVLVVVTIFYMPLVVPLMLGSSVSIRPWDIALSLIPAMLIPLVVGLSVRRRFEQTAIKLASLMTRLSSAALIVIVGGLLILNFNSLLASFANGALLAAIIFMAVAFGIGYALGRRSWPTRSVMALGTAQRDLSAAFLVATRNFGDQGNVLVMVTIVGLAGLIGLVFTARLLSGSRGMGRRASQSGT
jgi:BASS family bile acid:Na+ symporter